MYRCGDGCPVWDIASWQHAPKSIEAGVNRRITPFLARLPVWCVVGLSSFTKTGMIARLVCEPRTLVSAVAFVVSRIVFMDICLLHSKGEKGDAWRSGHLVVFLPKGRHPPVESTLD